MKIFKTLLICLSFSLLASCANTTPNLESSNPEPQEKPIVYSGPVNPQATEDAAAVLKYLTDLSNGTLPGVISGQNCFHGDQITSENYFDGYNTMMVALYEETGKFPGIIGLDYEYERIYTSEQLSAANEVLIDYWNEGGLVMITWTPKNPGFSTVRTSIIITEPGMAPDMCRIIRESIWKSSSIRQRKSIRPGTAGSTASPARWRNCRMRESSFFSGRCRK